MTANQIAYQKHLEDKRHNVAAEGETSRHNLADELQKRNELIHKGKELAETARHNVAGEKLGLMNYDVNLYDAQTRRASQEESVRSNMQNEALKAEQNRETARANEANEAIRDREAYVKEQAEQREQDFHNLRRYDAWSKIISNYGNMTANAVKAVGELL